jgi:hypothetical protein
MVDPNSSQIVLKRFHLLHVNQNADFGEFSSQIFNYNPVGYKASRVSPHAFIVDWQIPESGEDEKKREYFST